MSNLLKEIRELFDGEAGLTQDGAKKAFADFLAFRDDSLSEGVIAVHDDVAAFLTNGAEAPALEGGDTFTA